MVNDQNEAPPNIGLMFTGKDLIQLLALLAVYAILVYIGGFTRETLTLLVAVSCLFLAMMFWRTNRLSSLVQLACGLLLGYLYFSGGTI